MRRIEGPWEKAGVGCFRRGARRADAVDEVQEEDFEEGRYKWVLARKCSHMFTHHWGKSGERKRKREERAEPIYEDTARWLAKALES